MSDLIALVADGNTSAARRARVRLQPRDDKGRWVITGAALSAGLRTNTGAEVRVTGKAIGGTATAKGQKNNIRMLADAGFEEYGITPGTVLTVDPKNATLESKVKLNRDFLESKGIDPDLQHTLPKTLDRQPQTLAEMDPQPADDLDIELANGGLTDEEDKDFRAERDAEPLAKLPPSVAEGLEKLSKVDIAKLFEEQTKEKPGLVSKVKNYLKDLKASKISKPSLVGYSRSKREVYGQGDNPIVVPASDYGNFAYIDADGKRQNVTVSKSETGFMEIDFPFQGKTTKLQVKQDRDTKKWGVYSKADGDSAKPGDLLEEFDSYQDAREAAYSSVNDALGFDPDNMFSLAEGKNALRRRNENPRTKYQRDAIDLKPSKEYSDTIQQQENSTGDVATSEKVASDLMADVQYGGEIDASPEGIDALINRAKAPTKAPDPDEEEDADADLPGSPTLPTPKAPAGTVLKYGDEWKRGDKLFSPSGKEVGTVLGNSKPVVSPATGKPGYAVNILNADGNVETIRVAKDYGLYVPKAKGTATNLPADPGFGTATPAPAAPAAKAPAAPAAPASKPAPAAPAAPATPAPKPVSPPKPKPSTTTTKPPASTPKPPPVIPAGREDKGQDVPPNLTPLRDMQKVKVANLIDPTTGKPVPGATRGTFVQDPNAIYNALLENNPQAVVNKNGHIVVERQSFTDNDGRVWKYQITVERTHGNKYMERYTFTDDKGNVKDFYHYDYKDSFAAIYGDKNGVYVFRDQLLGRSIPGKQPPTRNTLNYFGPKKTLNDRIRFFRGMTREGFEPTLEDLNKTSFKLLTPEEVVNKYSVGRAQKENKSGQARGTVLQSFVPSIFEAVETDDPNLFEGRLLQLLGHLPDDEDSRNLLINSLRSSLKQKFNGTPLGRKVAPLANNIEKKILTEGFDLRDISRRPYSSRDGKTIVEPGDKIRYWNNVGDWSIGEVISQLPPVQSSGGKNSYDDVVAVKFKDGKIHLLRSNRMDILGDELDLDLNLHDKDSEPSDYKPSLQGKALRDARGYTYTFGDKERRADDNDGAEPDDVVNTADLDAAAPYLGEEGVSAEEAEAEGAEAPSEGNIGNFEAGDIWPDEDGDRMGTFVEAQKVSDPETGVQAWAVIWLDDDGDEQLEIIPIDSSRSPK
ncbi:MAG: hypothetical protein EBS38_01315 [Actinobacteria bacterium]|nr:hypothetical protein [Actinomycetota bacterium]